MGERNEPDRGDSDRAPRRRAPFGGSRQSARAEIQHPVMGKQAAVTNIKRLVIDEQADQLTVGHIDERLTRFGRSILAFGLKQWAKFVETVQIRSRQSM